jgi:E3 ubiquitin-protein ligase HUWE1
LPTPTASNSVGKLTAFQAVSPAAPAEQQLGSFIDRHRVSINAILRVSPHLLDGSFSPCVLHAHAIDFDNKKAFFREVIRKRSSDAHAGSILISVRRDRVFDDSYHQLRALSAHQMKGRLPVQFSGEEGVDASGVTRQWYVILARQIFDPNYALLCHSAAKAATYGRTNPRTLTKNVWTTSDLWVA